MRTFLIYLHFFHSDGLETLCYEDEFTGELRLKYTGCSVDGQLHGANDFWNDPSNRLWYFCEQLGSDRLRLNYGGCVWGEERIAKGKQIVRDGVVYTCHEKIADQEHGLRPSGCMHFAKRFNLGNTFQVEFQTRPRPAPYGQRLICSFRRTTFGIPVICR